MLHFISVYCFTVIIAFIILPIPCVYLLLLCVIGQTPVLGVYVVQCLQYV